MGNIFVFTGENSFTLRQEVAHWMKGFMEKHGEANLIRLDAAKLSLSSFLNEAASAPFLAEHRLIIIEGIPAFSIEKKGEGRDLKAILDEVHPRVVLLFVDPKPDKRLSVVKQLLALATVRDFPPLKGTALLQWAQAELRGHGGRAGPAILSALLDRIGEDQERLTREIAKLTLYAGDRGIVMEDLDALVLPSRERAVWHLLDLLGEGKTEEAVLYCRTLLQGGESVHGIWNIFLWITASFGSVAAAVEEGSTSIQSVMDATGVKFTAARSLIPLARKVSRPAVRMFIDRVTDADLALKTGAFRATADGEEELATLLDGCLMAFPR